MYSSFEIYSFILDELLLYCDLMIREYSTGDTGIVCILCSLVRRLSEPWSVYFITEDPSHELEIAFLQSLLR